MHPSSLGRLEQSGGGRRLSGVIVAEKPEDDIRIKVIATYHRPAFCFSLAAAHAARDVSFSFGSRGWEVWADPKSDMMSGMGLTEALPSGISCQTTSVDFQRVRKWSGMVVWPLLEI